MLYQSLGDKFIKAAGTDGKLQPRTVIAILRSEGYTITETELRLALRKRRIELHTRLDSTEFMTVRRLLAFCAVHHWHMPVVHQPHLSQPLPPPSARTPLPWLLHPSLHTHPCAYHSLMQLLLVSMWSHGTLQMARDVLLLRYQVQTRHITRWQYAQCVVMCAFHGLLDKETALVRKRSRLRLQQVRSKHTVAVAAPMLTFWTHLSVCRASVRC